MLHLYHGTTSVCAAKVRLALHEKALDWTGEVLDLQRGDQLRPEYRALNPNAVVPTLVHDGRVIIESTLIIAYLDDAFPSPALMPEEPYWRALARLWMKKIDDHLHPACSTVSYAIAFRNALLNKSPEEIEAKLQAMPDAAYRERQRLAISHGLDAPHVPPALRRYDQYVGEMEEALSASRYLAGDRYSLADIAITPYFLRADMLGLDRLWSGRRPNVSAWYARIRERPSFQQALLQWIGDADRERLRVSPDEVWPKVEAILARR
jgi:glutathione S-transferase